MGLLGGLAPLSSPVRTHMPSPILSRRPYACFPYVTPLPPLHPTPPLSSLPPLGLPARGLAARLGHHLLPQQRVGLVVACLFVHVVYDVRRGVREPEFIEYRTA